MNFLICHLIYQISKNSENLYIFSPKPKDIELKIM